MKIYVVMGVYSLPKEHLHPSEFSGTIFTVEETSRSDPEIPKVEFCLIGLFEFNLLVRF